MKKSICLLSLLFAYGCAGARRMPAATSPTNAEPNAATIPSTVQPAAMTTASAPAEPAGPPCFNTQYHFTCRVPKGYVIADEKEGPGAVMTLSQTTLRASIIPVSITVKAYPLGRSTLERFVGRRVTNGLEGAKDVTHWEKNPAGYGNYQGFEVTVDRQYSSGQFKSRIFAFVRDPYAILVDITAPAETYDGSQNVLGAFVSSISFDP